MAYLPSKKFIIALIILLAGVGMFWFFKNKKTENNPLFPKDKSFLSLNFGQGEKNWEEVLWEIASSSPNINPKIFVAKDSSAPEDSLTENIAKDFISQYLTIKQLNTGKLSTTTKEMLVNSVLADARADIAYKLYKITDLKISQNNNKDNIKNYGNQLGLILGKYNGPYSPGTELMILKDSVQNNDSAKIETLNKNIDIYNGLVQDCLSLEVPSDLANTHLGLVNSISQLKETTNIFKNFFIDPTKALVALSKYYGIQGSMVESLISFKNYFSDKGIFFNQNEPGYIIQNLK